MSEIKLSNLSKSFGLKKAVDSINLDIKDGELVTLLGPSGCGKTTILRMIAGLEIPDKGEIIINGKNVSRIPPWERNCGFVFQKYALFPHLSIFENIAYGLRVRKKKESDIKEKIELLTKMLDITDLLKRYPRQLSGGEQQRVSVARALVIDPVVLLMDEPLTGLDAKLRENVRFELKNIQRKVGITTIYVTHDQEEALVLADRIIVMNAGQIEQVGEPMDLYYKPKTAFVAEFIGSNNVFEGIVKEVDNNEKVADILLSKGFELKALKIKEPLKHNDKVVIILKTSNISLYLQKEEINSKSNIFKMDILGSTFIGSIMRLFLQKENINLKVDLKISNVNQTFKKGDTVNIKLDSDFIECYRK